MLTRLVLHVADESTLTDDPPNLAQHCLDVLHSNISIRKNVHATLKRSFYIFISSKHGLVDDEYHDRLIIVVKLMNIKIWLS